MKKVLAILLLTVLAFGCKNDKTSENTAAQDTVKNDNSTVEVFYLVPGPQDVLRPFSNVESLQFNADLLNPVENLDKYETSLAQELNFGIYSADLAFCAAFNKSEETSKYFNVVMQLADKVGVSELFDDQLVDKIKNVEANKDSLLNLSNEVYLKMKALMERNNKEASMAIIVAGGWIEIMYLIINQVNYTEDDPLVQKIADQKNVFSNLINNLKQNENNPNVKQVLEDLQPISDIYNSLPTENVENGIKIKLDEANFKKLKETINKIRNKFTQNNV